MSDLPLVSVICLCHNHDRFVEESINSVLGQTHPAVELIVVDDASADQSVSKIKKKLANNQIPFIELEQNIGNTRAFNKGLQIANGKYVIDLAADDILCPDRIEKQVAFFEKNSENTGVIYSDAEYIDENGNSMGFHFSSRKYQAFEGDVYEKLIDTFFIPPPTMMMKKEVLDKLNGYDENLAYEDFDFWIRSSRKWQYAYQPDSLTKIRKVKNSLSSRAYRKNDRQLYSTFLVCEKIQKLNKTPKEELALIRRLKYEIRHAVLSGNFSEAELFFNLLSKVSQPTASIQFLKLFNKLRIDFSILRNLYLKFVG